MKKVSEVFLVYPDDFPSYYSNLCAFYLELYNLIPSDIILNIIVNNNEIVEVLSNVVERDFNPIVSEGFDEIWLRDFMGFAVNDFVVKPDFKPDYFSQIYTSEKVTKIKKYSTDVLDQKGCIQVGMELTWDGGNLVSNSKIGFITDKLFKDNPTHPSDAILVWIRGMLRIEPIIVPTSKHDTLGHIDGYMSFLEEDTICKSKYPESEFLKSENEYLEKLREAALKEGLKIVDVYDDPTDERCTINGESIESAKGCYVNFLKLNNTIILPVFNQSHRTANNFRSKNRETFEELGYEVETIDCTTLSELGGVLHCVSWEY